MTTVAGLDGCPGGWMVVRLPGCDPARAEAIVAPRLEDVLLCADAPTVAAIDMPIGLPERVGIGGRVAEQAVRPGLGARQSSVFSVPARPAVYAADYAEACRAALETSDPPRKVSRQTFHLFPKIRAVDGFLLSHADWRERLVECHPEVAFRVLNGGVPMALPKKVKGSPNPAGLAERRAFLTRLGFVEAFLATRPPRGAAPDDLLDAAVCALVALRRLRGEARPHPAEDVRDANGLRIAIWA